MKLLAIESSCDETSAAVLFDREVKSNVIASQKVHEKFGGVVPELASRAHQANIVPVVDQALKEAQITVEDLDAIAFTQGPGLMGSLHVGTSFAKSLSLALNKPLIAVHHMHAHILAHFIQNDDERYPEFPFLCLTVSGGHTQLVKVSSPTQMEVVGETIDDAAGEAFDKAAKVLGLPYPGGPELDKLAQQGNPLAFSFTLPQAGGYDYSFSGLKTSFLYFLRDKEKEQPGFVQAELSNICASYQHTIVKYLLRQLERCANDLSITHVAIAGGVSANSGLRKGIQELAAKNEWQLYIPPFIYCTDNAGMIGIAGYYLAQKNIFADLSYAPEPRNPF